MQLTWAMPHGLLRPPAAAVSFVFIQLVYYMTLEKSEFPSSDYDWTTEAR